MSSTKCITQLLHTKKVDFDLCCVCVDNVAPDSVPLYFGTALFFRLLGPLAGFGLGAICNHYYHDFSSKYKMNPDQDLSSHSWPYSEAFCVRRFMLWKYFVKIASFFAHCAVPKFAASDPRWISAWYIGFLVVATGLIVFGCLIVVRPLSYWQYENWGCHFVLSRDVRSL